MNIPFVMKTRPILIVSGRWYFPELWENYSKGLEDLLEGNLKDIRTGIEAIYLAKEIAEQMNIEYKIKINRSNVKDVDKYLQNIEKYIEKSFVRKYRKYGKQFLSRYSKSYYYVSFYAKRKHKINFTEFIRLVVEISPLEVF